MNDSDQPPSISAMVESVNRSVTGVAKPSNSGEDPTLASRQGVGLATQSIAQSMAIAMQDATDMLRNISTIETTAIGVATAKWVEMPENVAYKLIIDTAGEVIANTAKLVATIGQETASVLSAYEQVAKGSYTPPSGT